MNKIFLISLTMLVAFGSQAWADNRAKSTNQPLCFTAVGGSVTVKFSIKNVTHTIQYSTDDTSWSTYTSNSPISLAAGGKVSFRAESNQSEAFPFGNIVIDSSSIFRFTTTDGATVQASGNIMSLYGPDCPNLPLKPYGFACLFGQCALMTTAPELPATTLDTACYYGMFSYCTGLTEAPELPATTIGVGSYAYMFCLCESMTTPPQLPATTLDVYCYNGMFCDCTSLTEPPVLPAMEMIKGSYYLMFDGCTALRTTPALPATTLADSCYGGMFQGCTMLKTLPQLSATTLAAGCYRKMFYKCTSLQVNTSLPGRPWSIPATELVDNALDSMFFGTTGTMNLTPQLSTVYYVASDTSSVGIVSVSEANTAVFVREGCICVDGSECESVRVYDVAGRLLLADRCTSDTKLRMPAGIYLVQVGRRPAQRVAVAR